MELPDFGDYQGRFDTVKALCDTGALVMARTNVLLWQFPSEFVACFKDVWVATYLFYGSPFYAYLRGAGFHLNMWTINAGRRLVPWLEGADESNKKPRSGSSSTSTKDQQTTSARRVRRCTRSPSHGSTGRTKPFWTG